MSQTKPKYKRLESFFARIRPPAPDSPSRSTEDRPVVETTVLPANGWGDFFSGTQRRQMVGFSFDQVKVTSLENAAPPLPENALRVPLTVSGKTIGSIQAAGKEAGWTAQEIEIVSAVATELAQHLERLGPETQNKKFTP